MYQEFPKWVYPNGDASKAVLVQDAEQEAQLFPEVVTDTTDDTPAGRNALAEAAKALGIPVKGTWGGKKIAAAIAEKEAAQGE